MVDGMLCAPLPATAVIKTTVLFFFFLFFYFSIFLPPFSSLLFICLFIYLFNCCYHFSLTKKSCSNLNGGENDMMQQNSR